MKAAPAESVVVDRVVSSEAQLLARWAELRTSKRKQSFAEASWTRDALALLGELRLRACAIRKLGISKQELGVLLMQAKALSAIPEERAWSVLGWARVKRLISAPESARLAVLAEIGRGGAWSESDLGVLFAEHGLDRRVSRNGLKKRKQDEQQSRLRRERDVLQRNLVRLREHFGPAAEEKLDAEALEILGPPAT